MKNDVLLEARLAAEEALANIPSLAVAAGGDLVLLSASDSPDSDAHGKYRHVDGEELVSSLFIAQTQVAKLREILEAEPLRRRGDGSDSEDE